MSVREDRLMAEYETMKKWRSRVVEWRAIGNSKSPDKYEVTYHVKSIIGFDNGRPLTHTGFKVIIEFSGDYPRVKPDVHLDSQRPWPIHPNIWPDGRFCLEGDQHWIPGVGVPMDAICQMIGEILSYQEVNIRSAANGNAAMIDWVKKNLVFETGSNTKVKNPIDPSPIRLPDIDDSVKWGTDDQEPPQQRIVFG